MDKCTREIRKQYWKEIIARCQARPEGQTVKSWLKENQICEQTYYLWQRRIRQEVFEEMNESQKNVPVLSAKSEVAFAEIQIPVTGYSNSPIPKYNSINPVAIIKAANMTIAVSPDIPEHLLAGIIREATHA